MISRYEVFLNGVSLSSISPEILILDIQYPPTSIRNESFSLARRQGERISRRYIASNSVSVSFEIQSYDVQVRQSILSQIVKWAKNGGVLQTNDRIGQRLRCICETFPSITSAKDRTQEMQIVFKEMGCQVAYNLDGGGSATMVLNGERVNRSSGSRERDVSDIIYLTAQ